MQGETSTIGKRLAVLSVTGLVLAAVVSIYYLSASVQSQARSTLPGTGTGATQASSPEALLVSNSTSMSSITERSATVGQLDHPVLDSSNGAIYALTSTSASLDGQLSTIDPGSLTSRTVLALPGTGVGLSVDPSTGMVYVQTLGCNEGSAAPACQSDQEGFWNQEIVEVNGSTGQIQGEIPIETNESRTVVDPTADTLYSVQTCPQLNYSNPCSRLLKFDAGSGSLIQNASFRFGMQDLVLDSTSGKLYATSGWFYPGNATRTQGVVQLDASDLSVGFTVPLNFTNNIDLSVDEATNTVYGFADNILGSNQSAILVSIDGGSGRVVFSKVVGTACTVDGAPEQGAVVNSLTGQLYLFAQSSSPGQPSWFVALDGKTGSVAAMIPAGPSEVITTTSSGSQRTTMVMPGSSVQTTIVDEARLRVYVIFEGGTISEIPDAEFQGNVSVGALNAYCPILPIE